MAPSNFKKFKNRFLTHYSGLVLLILIPFTFTGCKLGSSTLQHSKSTVPTKTIAIANLGPHATLDTVILEFKKELTRLGYSQDRLRILENHVAFDQSLIPTMLQKSKADQPDLVLTLTTSVSQSAQRIFKNTPILFAAVTDPYEAQLVHAITEKNQIRQTSPSKTSLITGVSDLQDAQAVLKFIHKILPHATRIGIPFTPAEANDIATLKRFKAAADKLGFLVVEAPVEHARDIPVRIRTFKGKADCIYVTNSNVIQPAFPALISTANAIHLPVFNMSPESVKSHQALGSYSVSYEKIGIQAARMADRILRGETPSSIPVVFPQASEHEGFISIKVLKKFGIPVPADSHSFTLIGDGDA